MNNNKLRKIRKKIDSLDLKLLNIIKKRTNLVNQVIKTKKSKKEIVDKRRIKKILKNIKKLSKKKNIDTRITQRIWMSMINSYIEYERKNFKKK